MYFPYLRGRKYELLALQELAAKNCLGEHIIPIIEPIKLSSTLVKTLDVFTKNNQFIAVILNPMVGNFTVDFEDTSENVYQTRFLDLLQSPIIIKSLIMQHNVKPYLDALRKQNIEKESLLIIHTSRDYLGMYEKEFNSFSPHYVLIPDESTFRKKNQDLLPVP